MRVAQRKKKWVGYDDNGKIVIMSHDRQLVINYMERLKK